MNTPTKKPPLWHFAFSDIIFLNSNNVCKDGNFMFWKWNTVVRMLYFNIMRHYFTYKELVISPIQNFALIWKCAIFHKEGFSHGHFHILFFPRRQIQVETTSHFNVEKTFNFAKTNQRWNLTLFQRWNLTLFQCWNLTCSNVEIWFCFNVEV